MSFLIDSKYAMFLGGSLEGFKQVRRNLWNCRCPICGDSEKKKKKKRLYIYQPHRGTMADHLAVVCHNCGYSHRFSTFLKEVNESMYREYRMEIFKENGWSTKADRLIESRKKTTAVLEQLEAIEAQEEEPVDEPAPDPIDWVRPLNTAPEGHPVLVYAHSRCFPVEAYDILGWCDNFREEFGGFSDDVEDDTLPTDARLIIPIRDPDGKLIALQGRAIDKHPLRYITLKTDESVSKVFGLDRLVPDLPVMVVEGPLDSLFLPNCIATADANLLAAGIGDILVPDKQMRNAQLLEQIERQIDSGKYVCLLSDEQFPFKDINAAVQGGWTPSQIVSVILDNAKRGLSAKLALSDLRRVGKKQWKRKQ